MSKFLKPFLLLVVFLKAGTAHSLECVEDPSKNIWAAQSKDKKHYWNVIGNEWLWSDLGPAAVRWNQKSFQDSIFLTLQKANKNIDRKKIDEFFKRKDVSFLSQVLIIEVSKKAQSGLGYLDGIWLYSTASFVCKTSPLKCLPIVPVKDTNNLPMPETGKILKEHLSIFLRQFEKNSLPEFCKDVLSNKDPIFKSYEALIAQCEKNKGWSANWKSLVTFCDSLAAAQSQIKSAL